MKRLYRCRWDKKLAGVCGGLGHYFNIDPNIIRLVYVFVGCVTGFLPLIILYLIGMVVMPDGPKAYIKGNYKQLYRTPRDRKLSGFCGGLAEYLRIDSTIIRIAYIVLLFLTVGFPLIITYLVGSSIVPMKPN
ncbi:MAG: hypothetical protein SP1CHLAM54_07470 [Chlamydiia bacterium]|nr:hypothetical protein [Chlamydiia bacterium]MCH9615653.1 hypothetical protein [Chlamydiia bacterium]MCH9628944.1 hypothetical protein [Chlamydiia bacterium]